MAISITGYPDSNRVPGTFIKVDPSKANTGVANLRTLIIGQVVAGSSQPFTLGVASISPGNTATRTQAGYGSMLALMLQQVRARDAFGEVWLLPLADDPASTPSIGTVTFSGTPTVSGVVSIYVAGQLIRIPAPVGATFVQLTTAFVNAAALNPALPVTVSASGQTITLTSSFKGEAANEIDLRMNYYGSAGGEATPPGLTVTIGAMTGGYANPQIAPALLNLADQAFDYIVLPYTDTTNLNAMQAFLGDDTGRWSWSRMIYGHAFAAKRGTIGALTTFGTSRNDQHTSVLGFNDSPTPAWLWAADLAGAVGASLRADPVLPVQTLQMGVMPPPLASQFVFSDRNTLLYDGIATFVVAAGGVVQVERCVTTYQFNAGGVPDNSYLDVERLATLAFVCRDLRSYTQSQFARKKIVSDATRVTANNIVTPALIKASLISRYRFLEQGGYVQNSDTFAQMLQVEFSGNGLVKVLFPADLAGQLRQFAFLVQFTQST